MENQMQNLQPHEERMLKIIRDINIRTSKPARTISIYVQLSLNISERQIRYYLHSLEKRGFVFRKTPKTGYLIHDLPVSLRNRLKIEN